MKKPLPMFDVTLRVDSDGLAELAVDWGAYFQGAVPVMNGDTPVGSKPAITRRRTTYTHKNVGMSLGKKPTGYLNRSMMVALQVATKALAGRESVTREELAPGIKEAFRQLKLQPSGWSPAVSSLVKEGYLKLEEPKHGTTS